MRKRNLILILFLLLILTGCSDNKPLSEINNNLENTYLNSLEEDVEYNVLDVRKGYGKRDLYAYQTIDILLSDSYEERYLISYYCVNEDSLKVDDIYYNLSLISDGDIVASNGNKLEILEKKSTTIPEQYSNDENIYMIVDVRKGYGKRDIYSYNIIDVIIENINSERKCISYVCVNSNTNAMDETYKRLALLNSGDIVKLGKEDYDIKKID